MLLFVSGDEKNNDEKEIAFSELVVAPSFIRFGHVSLLYPYTYPIGSSQSIDERCESFHRHLLSIKSSLYDAVIISFVCQINKEDQSQFSSYSTSLEHIRGIVSICDSSRGYSFIFDAADKAEIGNVITPILEMPAISRSSTVYITSIANSTVTQLPIETISHWLNRERNEIDQIQRERNLVLVCSIQDSQIQEMCEFLKQVSLSPLFSNIHLAI